MNISFKTYIQKLPKLLFLGILLIGALLLDGLAYGFLNTCPACTSFGQFITTPAAVSSSLIASIAALFSLTLKRK